LEHTYGSFVRGAIAKMRQPKTPRDLLATKKVFSAEGGLQRLILFSVFDFNWVPG